MKSLFYRSLLVATCLVVSTPALAITIDGFLDDSERTEYKQFTAGWYNGHNEAGSQFKKAGDHMTTVYWKNTPDNFYLYLEVPLAAKTMTWGPSFAEGLLYYEHWCSPPDGETAAIDGSNCQHHGKKPDKNGNVGFDQFVPAKVGFGTMTGSEKVEFENVKLGDLAKGKSKAAQTLFGAALQDYKDSVDYVIASLILGCDITDCGAILVPMAFEFKYDALSPESEANFLKDFRDNELEFHLSPERSALPVPEPSAAVLFCVGALLVGNSIRRQPRAR